MAQYEPSSFMYDNKDFRQPKTPFVGMQLGEMKGSLEIKLWLEIYVHLKQERKRSIYPQSDSGSNYTYKCTSTNKCSFHVQVTQLGKKNWRVCACDLVHDDLCTSIPTISTKVAIYMNLNNKLATKVKPKVFLTDMRSEGTFVGSGADTSSKAIGYDQVWMAQRALKLFETDTFEDGFAYLPGFLARLRAENPGSIIVLDTKTVEGPNGTQIKQFYRLFVMLNAQANVAIYSRHVVSYDGAFPKVIEMFFCCWRR